MFFLQNCIPTYVLIQNLVLDSSSLEFFIKIAYILIYLHTKLKLKNQKSKPVSQQEKKIHQIHFIRNQKLKPITQQEKQRANSDPLHKDVKIEIRLLTYTQTNLGCNLFQEPISLKYLLQNCLHTSALA